VLVLRESFWIVTAFLAIANIAVLVLTLRRMGKPRRTAILISVTFFVLCISHLHTFFQSAVFNYLHPMFEQAKCRKCTAMYDSLFAIYDQVPERAFYNWCESNSLLIEDVQGTAHDNLIYFDRERLAFPDGVKFFRNRTANLRVYWLTGKVYVSYFVR
jgi:hypothetical protein